MKRKGKDQRVKTLKRRPRKCGRESCKNLTPRSPERLRLFEGYLCRTCAAVTPPDIDILAAGLAVIITSPPPLTERRG